MKEYLENANEVWSNKFNISVDNLSTAYKYKVSNELKQGYKQELIGIHRDKIFKSNYSDRHTWICDAYACDLDKTNKKVVRRYIELMMDEIPNSVGIYSIEFPKLNSIYIGKSLNIQKRVTKHLSDLNHNVHQIKELQIDYNLLGLGEVNFNVVELLSKEEADTEFYLSLREVHHIVSYKKTDKKVYNSDGYMLSLSLEKAYECLSVLNLHYGL